MQLCSLICWNLHVAHPNTHSYYCIRFFTSHSCKVIELDARHDYIFNNFDEFPNAGYDGYCIDRENDGWWFVITHPELPYNMQLASL